MSLLTVDGCNNYTVLSEADRAQGHIVINASNYRCDRDDLVPGWYRFQGAAGDQMAENCVPENHCGSRWPGWLSGAHPSIAEGVVTRRVCFSSSYSCCNWYQNIRIRNCGAYFVYELPRPYPSCPARYCGNGSAGKFHMIHMIKKGVLQINTSVLVGSYLVGILPYGPFPSEKA